MNKWYGNCPTGILDETIKTEICEIGKAVGGEQVAERMTQMHLCAPTVHTLHTHSRTFWSVCEWKAKKK